MPSYNVTAVGFHDGKMYDPRGKRRVLTVELPFDGKKRPFPSWVDKKPVKATGNKAAGNKAAGNKAADPSFISDDSTQGSVSAIETL